MAQPFSLPRGTSDILPQEVFIWQTIEKKAKHLFNIYNYQEIRTPCFEDTELFSRSMGAASDVVNKQMLHVASQEWGEASDLKQSKLSLRPEGTASVVRSYIKNRLDKKEGLSKLFYIGPMFRGERPQKGRLRQFHQIGIEAIGPQTASPYLDAEVIALSVNLLENFGIKGFQLKINSLGSSEDKANFSQWLRKALKEKLADLCEDCQERFERNVFRILDCKNRICQTAVQELKIGESHLGTDSQTYYQEVKQALVQLNVSYQESPTLVRGLDYYTHTVFEISHADLGSQDALGAGGRYGNLVSQLGGPEVDAIGFALGIERMILAMPEISSETTPLDVFIIGIDQAAFAKAFGILNNLRQAGIASEINYKGGSMKSQMRAADKSGAKYVMILGEEEIKVKKVTLKDMKSGDQKKIAWEMIVEELRSKRC